MENNKCNLCNMIFTNKFSLERHQNKKIKCTKTTDFRCLKCNKCFSQKKSLIYHIENNICKSIQSQNQSASSGLSESELSLSS